MLIYLLDYVAESLLHHQRFATLNHSPLPSPPSRLFGNQHMNLRALNLFVIAAASVFAWDHSSEQPEAQITRAQHRLFYFPFLFLANENSTSNTKWTAYCCVPLFRTGQALWSQKVACPNIPSNRRTDNVTYDYVKNPDSHE